MQLREAALRTLVVLDGIRLGVRAVEDHSSSDEEGSHDSRGSQGNQSSHGPGPGSPLSPGSPGSPLSPGSPGGRRASMRSPDKALIRKRRTKTAADLMETTLGDAPVVFPTSNQVKLPPSSPLPNAATLCPFSVCVFGGEGGGG